MSNNSSHLVADFCAELETAGASGVRESDFVNDFDNQQREVARKGQTFEDNKDTIPSSLGSVRRNSGFQRLRTCTNIS